MGSAAMGRAFCLNVFRAGSLRVRSTTRRPSDILTSLNLDAGTVLTTARDDTTKAQLRQQTDEAQRLGIFGAPSFRTPDGELFWGNDRLERALQWAQSGR